MADQSVHRRRWTVAEKQRILAEVSEPGASVSKVARRYDVNANLVFRWLRNARQVEDEEAATFLPVEVTAAPADEGNPVVCGGRGSERDEAGRIDIDLPCGARVRCDGTVNERALARVLRALGHRR